MIKSKFRVITYVYWIMLSYIIAALVWWFISLERQNQQMYLFKYQQLVGQNNGLENSARFEEAKLQLIDEKERNSKKYIGEGATFLALILLGAAFVYRSVRKQWQIQQQQQNFMMAITHELKTPIAVAKLNLETLQKHQLEETKRQKILQMTIQETNRLNALTNNILVSSQLEGNSYRASKEDINLTDLVNACIQDFKVRFPNKNWTSTTEPDAEIVGDPLLITILVNNLLENANKYTPNNQTVSCELKKEEHRLVLSVIDQGPGIPNEEKNKVFEKFYRVGNEATRTTKGTGLGLYLCKKIAESHRASIQIRDNNPTGCIFTVTFKI